MTIKFNLPDSYDFHEKVYRRITHGNFQRVANELHKHRSQLSREWNPEEPQNSTVYEAGLELAAWKKIQPEIFEMQAEALTDLIVSLRADGKGGTIEGEDAELKKLCDGMTTALLTRDEGEIRSAMVKLNAFTESRLRQRMSPAERMREARFAG